MTNEESPIEEQEGIRKQLKYSARQRRGESNSTVRSKRMERRKPDEIHQLENILSTTNSKSPSIHGFKQYLLARFYAQEQLYEYYGNNLFRIYRWMTWKNRKSSEDRFINKIGTTFGDNLVLAYGVWHSWKGMKGLASSPTVGIKRRIAQKYKVIDTPEWNTTKTCSRCEGEMEGDPTRTTTNKDGKVVPLRGIRRCNNEDYCGGLLRWNRDHNAAINRDVIDNCWYVYTWVNQLMNRFVFHKLVHFLTQEIYQFYSFNISF